MEIVQTMNSDPGLAVGKINSPTHRLWGQPPCSHPPVQGSEGRFFVPPRGPLSISCL